MPGIRGAGSLLLLAALLMSLLAEDNMGGLEPLEAAGLLGLGGASLLMAASIVEGFGRHWTYGVQSLAVSTGLFMGLLVVYASREELMTTLDRTIGNISMGRTVATSNGEVVAARRLDGSFMVAGKVNGRDARFVFDTGASTVVLRGEQATALGFNPETLNFSIPVSTANGTAMAASVIIETMAVGPILERNVRALIARPGVLHANLLGMTFLERLRSYEVRGSRLILRAGNQS